VKYSPDFFEASYFDFNSAAYRIATGDAWALIGPKGAGKSVSFEYLKLKWQGNPQKFLMQWDLASFPVDLENFGFIVFAVLLVAWAVSYITWRARRSTV
jgi:hypothetical protein